MKIQELHLKNFRQFSNLDLKFSKINVISGETGEGKSSVLEALSLGLCDTVKKNLENCINWKASKAEVNLKTNYRGELLDYTINLGKKTSRELLYKNETLLNSDALKELEKIIDPKLTLYSNFSLQKKTSEILQDKPTARLQKIKSLFKIDRINKNVISQIKLDITELESKILKLETQLATLKQRTFLFLGDPKFEQIDAVQVEKEISGLKVQKLEYEKKKDAYDIYIRDYNAYKTALFDISIYKENINKYRMQIAESAYHLKQTKDFNLTEYQNLDNSISKIRQQLDICKQITDKESELSSIKLNRPSRVSKESVKEKISSIEQNIETTQNQIQEENIKYNLYKNKICPVTKLQCSAVKEDIDSDTILDSISKLKLELDYNKSEKIRLQNEIVSIEDIENKNIVLSTKRDYIQKSISELSNQVQGLNITTLENTYGEKLVYYDVLKLVYQDNIANEKFNKNIKENVQTLEQKVAMEQGKVQELEKVSKPDIKEAPIEFDDSYFELLKVSLQEHQFNLKESERIINFNKQLKIQEKENTKLCSQIENETYELRNKVVQLKELSKLLDKQFSSWLISTGTSYIKDRMNEFFDKSYGKYYIDFAYEGDGLELVYSESRNDTNFHSTEDLSGFESDIYSLAFRTALCSLQDLDFLIYDEIDSQGSTERSINLFKTILDTLGDRQLFVVTHNDDVKEFLIQQENAKLFEFKGGTLLNNF